MGRALLVISGPFDRRRAADWCMKAPVGTRIEFKAARRSLDQNALMWALLTEVSTQKEHHGNRYTPDQWKVLFMHACGREVQFLPGLDGKTFLPWGQSSSDLSKQEMTDLIEFILSWGAENGVIFHDPQSLVVSEPGGSQSPSPETPAAAGPHSLKGAA